MDEKKRIQKRENMRPRKQKSTIPPKLRINLLSDAAKRDKTKEANETVHAMSSKYLDLDDYAHLYKIIHCQYGLKIKITKDPMVGTVLTQYHVSKDIKLFGKPGIKAVMK